MPLVEGIKGTKPVRYCDCGEYTLQLAGSYYDHIAIIDQSAPSRFSHYPDKCPCCLDKERLGESIGDTA